MTNFISGGSDRPSDYHPASRQELLALDNAVLDVVKDEPETILRCYAHILDDSILKFEHTVNDDPGCGNTDTTAITMQDTHGDMLVSFLYGPGGYLHHIDVGADLEPRDIPSLMNGFIDSALLNQYERLVVGTSRDLLCTFIQEGTQGFRDAVNNMPDEQRQAIEDMIIGSIAAKSVGHLVMQNYETVLPEGVWLEASTQKLSGVEDESEWEITPIRVVHIDKKIHEALIYTREWDGRTSLVHESVLDEEEDEEADDQEFDTPDTQEVMQAIDEFKHALGQEIPIRRDVLRITGSIIDAIVSDTSIPL